MTVQEAIENKTQYIIDHVNEGPLSSFEEGELTGILQSIDPTRGILSIAINQHFSSPSMDHSEFIATLASQAKDDFCTMISTVGLKATILLLRTLKN